MSNALVFFLIGFCLVGAGLALIAVFPAYTELDYLSRALVLFSGFGLMGISTLFPLSAKAAVENWRDRLMREGCESLTETGFTFETVADHIRDETISDGVDMQAGWRGYSWRFFEETDQ